MSEEREGEKEGDDVKMKKKKKRKGDGEIDIGQKMTKKMSKRESVDFVYRHGNQDSFWIPVCVLVRPGGA